jgi:hypothetical protein
VSQAPSPPESGTAAADIRQHAPGIASTNPAGPAMGLLVQAEALLKADQARTQAGAQALQALQSALRQFEQALIEMSPPPRRGAPWKTLITAQSTERDLMTLDSLLQACNTLDQSLKELILGSPQTVGPRVLGSDSGVVALRSRIRSTLLLNVDGHSLIHYGLQLSDQGVYEFNIEDCRATVDRSPTGLANVLGSTGQAHPSGVLGAFVGMVRSWTDRHTGLIRQRLHTLEARQRNTAQRRAWLCARCEQALAPRLAQLRLLQRLNAELQTTRQGLQDLERHDTGRQMPP